ncbi:hypothetical protein HPB50_025076 [Hyalomma asiaticum]|uniref:Uncharacterized protein n=1 Tax=Hyalomma asiaticum TaxID=266040 RepID=A0ACB7TQV1_HYAAI|nr:hypothetical protein HPB50_025076 [Hyalomma asiaticum]
MTRTDDSNSVSERPGTGARTAVIITQGLRRQRKKARLTHPGRHKTPPSVRREGMSVIIPASHGARTVWPLVKQIDQPTWVVLGEPAYLRPASTETGDPRASVLQLAAAT